MILLFTQGMSRKNRSSRDTHDLDEHGKKLFYLCKSNSLCILNGRTHGVRKGNLIHFPPNLFEHPSMIDFMAADPLLLSRVKFLHSFSRKNCVIRIVYVAAYTLI